MHPVMVRHMISPMLERLLGRRTFDKWRRFQRAQWWDRDLIESLQRAKLSRLLAMAQKHCPFYASLFETYQVRVGATDPFVELAKAPPLTKDTFRRNLPAMTHRRTPGGLIPLNTGGSTGQPLSFYVDRRRIAYDKAARMLTHEWFNVSPGEREVYLWGSPIELSAQDQLKRFRDHITNELLLEAFNLSPERIDQYVRRINAFKPKSIFGYPSSLAIFAEYAEQTGQSIEDDGIAAVFTTGEVLTGDQRERLERFFAAPVADCYGSRDGGFIAHECREGAMHVMAHSVIVEIVDDVGNRVPDGVVGEIVVTHLDAHGTLFIRYRTGDLGAIHRGACDCGRQLPILENIQGRRTDQLVAEDGSLKHGLSAIYVLRSIPGIRQFRIDQQPNRDVDIRIVTDSSFGDDDLRHIRSSITDQLGASIEVRVSRVERIDTQASGKFRQVVSDATGFLGAGHHTTADSSSKELASWPH